PLVTFLVAPTCFTVFKWLECTQILFPLKSPRYHVLLPTFSVRWILKVWPLYDVKLLYTRLFMPPHARLYATPFPLNVAVFFLLSTDLCVYVCNCLNETQPLIPLLPLKLLRI